jgi:hypothetical protein
MDTAKPFSLRIFIADGDPDGLRLVERSNWIGKAVVFPRSLLPTIKKRDEFNQTGVYLLLGPVRMAKGRSCTSVRVIPSGRVSRVTTPRKIFGAGRFSLSPDRVN